MGVARANTALPAFSAQSNMMEACFLPLRAGSRVGPQHVCVATNQVVALCYRPHLWSVMLSGEHPERARVPVSSTAQEAVILKLCFLVSSVPFKAVSGFVWI